MCVCVCVCVACIRTYNARIMIRVRVNVKFPSVPSERADKRDERQFVLRNKHVHDLTARATIGYEKKTARSLFNLIN